jgi:hypothetical protein
MRVKINQSGTKVVAVNQQSTIDVVSVGVQGPMGPSGVTNISDATDVDTTNLQNGAVLVYKATTNKWTSTTTLDAQNMEGGEF